jgi:Cu(I)-responsive transcriptional regulator
MNVGQAARLSGLPVRTIHYYEDIDLVVPTRRGNGYRDYGDSEVHKLRFLQRARSLGFSLKDCRNLLALYQDRHRASADVKALATARIEEIDRKIAELQSLRATLAHLVEACHGDARPDCPILDDLAGEPSTDPTPID